MFDWLRSLMDNVWNLINGFNEDRLYVLNRKDVFQKYIEYGVDDVAEFAAMYTFHWHETFRKQDDIGSKERMCREVYQMMSEIQKVRELDR